MSEIIKPASEQFEQSLESVLTNDEQKKIALHIGSVLFAGGLLVAGKVHEGVFPGYESITGVILFIGAIIAAAPVFSKAIKGFISSNSEYVMEQLVSLALLASIVKGYYQTAILIPLIMAVVHFLEERSILGAKSAIEGLKTLQAKKACLINQDGEEVIPTDKLEIGDIIKVRPGDVIPVDGKVVEGQSSIDQSSLTGETVPVDVCIKDKVYAGTINIQGVLIICVTKKANETSLSKIVELLRETEQSKTSAMRIIEQYSSYYLPLVIIIAAGVLFMTQEINRVIAIFVVACPCAQILVSSTAMVAALSVSSRNGILLKNSKFLEVLGDVKTVIFDKTGTLTAGRLDVISINAVGGVSNEELLCTAAAAAWTSKHPVSKAIVRAARDLPFEKITISEESAGMGVALNSSRGRVLLGNRGWFENSGLTLPAEPAHYGPVVWAACDKRVLGCILLADYLRVNAKEAVSSIRELGTERVILVSGDRKEAVEVLKEQLCLDDTYANCLPSNKLDIVEREKEGDTITMVIGDGINDALALAKADVGVAMGAMGADIAVQSADIVLMGNELEKLSFIIKLSQKTKSIIYQNMVIATLSSATMLLLAGLGIITPLIGAFFHNIGAFLVLFNSSRLLKYDNKTYNEYA